MNTTRIDCGGLATRASAVNNTDPEKRVLSNSAGRPGPTGPQSPFITDARIAITVLLALPVGFMVGAGLCVLFMAPTLHW